MLIFAISILSILQRVLGKDEICQLDSFSACAPPDTFPLNLPENEIELDRVCTYMPCVRNHEISCNEYFPYEEEFKRVYQTSEAICKEGSHLHQQLGKNVRCMKKVLKKHNNSCSEGREKIVEAYLTHIYNEVQKVEEELTNDDWEVIFCLRHSYDIGCYLRDVEECGDEAKEVTLFIVRNSGFVLDGCPDSVKITILFLLNSMDLHYYQEKLIKDVIQLTEEK